MSTTILTAYPAFGQTFVLLHGPDRQVIYLNTHEITTIREPTAANRRHFVAGTRCVVVLTNGNFVAVQEGCEVVHARVEAVKPLPHPE